MSSRDADMQMQDVSAPSARSYRRYVLGILLVVSTLNYLDRQIINILVEPIKSELNLADWQLGLVTGLSFALFYTILGIPIARLADRGHRPWIIAASLSVWSAFTLACGLAQNFVHLLLARVGVGIGEAGGSPPAHSLISDYTTPENRASALAVFSLGVPIGALLGLGAGGLLAETLGWRMAFFIAAAPGLLLAVVIVLTVKEPRKMLKGASKPAAPTSLRLALRELQGKTSFWWLAGAAASAAFVINGHGAFYGSYFLRQYSDDLGGYGGIGPLGLAGLILGLVRGVSGIIGTLAGGYWTDRGVVRDRRAYCSIPALCMFLSAPAFALVFVAPNAAVAGLLLFIPGVLSAAITAPTFAAVQTMVAPGTRATAAAVLFFLLNMIGLGLGPLVVGILSDHFGPGMGRTGGLGAAMLWICPLMLLSGFCYLMARRTIVADLRSE